jgi:hypothetical protein
MSSINRREFLNPIGQPFFVPPLRLERTTTGLEVVQFFGYMVFYDMTPENCTTLKWTKTVQCPEGGSFPETETVQ